MSQAQIEASPEVRQSLDEARLLRLANAKLEEQLAKAKEELREAQQTAVVALRSQARLRRLLEPWRTAILGVYNELAEIVDDPASDVRHSNSGGIWADRIAKASPSEGRVLRVLLDGGGPMTLQQIRAAAGTSSNTSTYLSRLIAKNWVHKTGHGSYALKEL